LILGQVKKSLENFEMLVRMDIVGGKIRRFKCSSVG